MNISFAKQIFVILLTFAVSLPFSAQNSVKEMRRRAGTLQKQIAEKEGILKSSQKDVKSKLQNLELITAKITEHKNLITLLSDEIVVLDDTIAHLEAQVKDCEKNVAKAKEEYAEALRRARRYGSLQDKLLFIVSAKDFNAMFRRYRYAREYMNAHKKVADRLKESISILETRRIGLDSIRSGKAASLLVRNQEKETLLGLEQEQRMLLGELQRESKKVQKELKKQRKQLADLNAQIDRIIEEEIEAQRKREMARAAKNKKSDSGSVTMREDEGVRKMSGSFLQNKGKLPAPITGPYHVVSEYGARKGVMTKGNVLIDNGGIVIQGKSGAQARCIFDGTVTAVFRTTDYALVLVRHGKYLSVYCQLDNIHVKNGDNVKAGTIIGDIAKNSSGHTRLLFQLRNEKQKLNPMQWLKL